MGPPRAGCRGLPPKTRDRDFPTRSFLSPRFKRSRLSPRVGRREGQILRSVFHRKRPRGGVVPTPLPSAGMGMPSSEDSWARRKGEITPPAPLRPARYFSGDSRLPLRAPGKAGISGGGGGASSSSPLSLPQVIYGPVPSGSGELEAAALKSLPPACGNQSSAQSHHRYGRPPRQLCPRCFLVFTSAGGCPKLRAQPELRGNCERGAGKRRSGSRCSDGGATQEKGGSGSSVGGAAPAAGTPCTERPGGEPQPLATSAPLPRRGSLPVRTPTRI